MFPGYKHVEAFGPDEEYEDEAEVSYVTLDLGNNVDKTLLPNTSEYRLIGLDTSTPMLQLSGTFFKGSYEHLLGTELLFTDGRDESNLSRKFVVPVATTERRIRFEQVTVKEKETKSQEEKEQERERLKEISRGRSKSATKGKGRGRGKGKGKGHPVEDPVPHGQIMLDLDTYQT